LFNVAKYLVGKVAYSEKTIKHLIKTSNHFLALELIQKYNCQYLFGTFYRKMYTMFLHKILDANNNPLMDVNLKYEIAEFL
jgi:hypothetical protein